MVTDEEAVLKRGDKGDAVARWQAFLRVQGFDPKGIDGDFGTNTSVATAHLQSALTLAPHGVLDRATQRRCVELGYVGDVPFLQAKSFGPPAGRDTMHWIVFHTMEAPEKGETAENVAKFFATQAPASAHYCIDADSIVQCVNERDVAWHAPGANRFGIGLEHAGYARQTPADWADDYSTAMLRRSALLAALLCVRWGIPPVLVDAAGLRAKNRGITTHKAVTDAFSAGVGHYDPGPAWPGDWYVSLVRDAMGRALPELPP